MRETYLNFQLEKQAGLPSGSTLLLNAFNQVHAQIWFNCFIILGIIGFLFWQIKNQQLSHLHTLQIDITRGRIEHWTPKILRNFLLSKLYDIDTNSVAAKFSFQSIAPINKRTQNNWPHVYVNPYIAYENWLIELLLLFVPFILIASLCIPSTSLAYSGGEIHLETASIKVTGHQWYWETNVTFPVTIVDYPYSRFNELSNLLKEISIIQDSQALVYSNTNLAANYQILFLTSFKRQYFLYGVYMGGLDTSTQEHSIWLNFSFNQTDLTLWDQRDLYPGIHRVYETLSKDYIFPLSFESLQQQGLTNIATPVPAMVWSRIVVDSADVIHSFWLWDYGIKLDCIPGNALQCYVFPKNYGISLGNCAEYCGTGHMNMSSVFKAYDPLYLSPA